MHESGMFRFEVVDTGSRASNKGVDWQKVFLYFENTKINNFNGTILYFLYLNQNIFCCQGI